MKDARSLLEDALELGDSIAKLEALDRAIRAGDAENVEEVSVEAREEMLETCFYVSDPERTLNAFTWLLARHDRIGAAATDTEQLLWQYKWVVGALTEFPQVSRVRVASVLDDLERRFRAHGNQMRAVHSVRCKTALRLGDLDVVAVELERMRGVPRDGLADCRACEADQEVEALIALDRLADARVVAAPILAGKLRCAEVPAWTYAHLMVPVLEAGDVEAAVELHVKGLPAAQSLGDKAAVLAHHHIQFLAMTGNLKSAVLLVRKHWTRASTPRDPELRMRFHAAVAVLAKRLLAADIKTVALRVPEAVSLEQHGAEIDVDALAEFSARDAATLAAAYDRRNCNSTTGRWVSRVTARADTTIEHRAIVTRVLDDD